MEYCQFQFENRSGEKRKAGSDFISFNQTNAFLTRTIMMYRKGGITENSAIINLDSRISSEIIYNLLKYLSEENSQE